MEKRRDANEAFDLLKLILDESGYSSYLKIKDLENEKD